MILKMDAVTGRLYKKEKETGEEKVGMKNKLTDKSSFLMVITLSFIMFSIHLSYI